MRAVPSARTVNIPNLLTLARLLVTPLFIILLLRDQMMPALMVFALAGISDGLDGLIAAGSISRPPSGPILIR